MKPQAEKFYQEAYERGASDTLQSAGELGVREFENGRKLGKSELIKELKERLFPEHGVIDVDDFPKKVFDFIKNLK